MAIGPIPDLRPLDVIQPRGIDPELAPVHRVDALAGSGNALAKRKQNPNRQDPDVVELAGDDVVETAAGPLPEPSATVADGDTGANINLFA